MIQRSRYVHHLFFTDLVYNLDSHSSPGMLQFASLITDIHPGIFIHSIYMDEDLDKDRKAGFVRNVVIPDSYTQLRPSCQIVRKR
jgi:hypothetical protein